jgi:hypothetical protein
MKNIFLTMVVVMGLTLSLEYVSEVHENGLPKVVKVFSSSYGKINLNKETGYYSDGSQEYQKTYYKGQIKSFHQWDEYGNKIKAEAGWTEERERKFVRELCRSELAVCECILEIVKKSFTYEEVIDIDGGNFEPYQERIENIRENLEKCNILNPPLPDHRNGDAPPVESDSVGD